MATRIKKPSTSSTNRKTAKPSVTGVAALKTAIGWIALAWRDDALVRLSLGHDSEPAALRALLSDADLAANHETVSAAAIPWKLRDRLKNYAAGKRDDFAD